MAESGAVARGYARFGVPPAIGCADVALSASRRVAADGSQEAEVVTEPDAESEYRGRGRGP
jgi:hypothetical protein